MGLTKTEIFTESQNKMALIAKTLGHPARIAILQELIKMNSCICGHLVLEIGLAQSTISQHLTALKQAGLIKGSISGTSVCYCIDEKVWGEVELAFSDFFSLGPTNNKDCC
ncbi:MAG: DNA-binding transcriptional ArsR family regulator [Arcticibacterium sp.]|jgi:DNA-binding transcriptional ArsR family regulator